MIDNNSKVSIEQLLYGSFIKYDTMTAMTNSAFEGSNASTLNVFIDMYSMIKDLYRFNSNIYIGNYTSLTSSIINLCAHIRSFFRTRYSVETKIFIVYSNNCPASAKQFYVNYNKKTALAMQNNAMTTDFIESNNKLLEVLCPYLPDIFFIRTNFESAVVIYDIILWLESMANSNSQPYRGVEMNYSPSIVYGKDVFLYQLPAIRNDVVLYRNKKKDGQDISWYVNNMNVITRYVEQSRIKDKLEHITYRFNPEIFSLLLALTSMPERGIRSILNLGTAIKVINEAINNKLILNGYNSDIYSAAYAICTGRLADQLMLVQNRYNAIDIKKQHNIYFNSPEQLTVKDSILNQYDPENVKLLNNKYFASNPLDLNRL